MAEYNFKSIESKWQSYWEQNKTFKTEENDQEKCYVLDMFPYPSGEGLHLGHILCFTATDIIARYKKLVGYNVLHPMGYDAFGLPAEQHAIETGQHPETTTVRNINNFRRQLKTLGYFYDWDREVSTADPSFYHWTQWIFLQLFKCWYNPATNKAESIDTLVEEITQGRFMHNGTPVTKEAWNAWSEEEKEALLSQYRLAYLSDAWVNWCGALGTVLANEEVINGLSERGGYPVEKKLMRQWSLRVTAYAERLLNDLESLDWTDSIKEAQRNWIGKSTGADIEFKLADSGHVMKVFTTRPDTIFGVTFMVIAPENTLVDAITTPEQREEVDKYLEYVRSRSERDRISETRKVTGVFTGAYAIQPITGEKVPVYASEYVLNSYGTGMIMAVPSDDERDKAFAQQFGLPIVEVVDENSRIINSDFLTGLPIEEAKEKIIDRLAQMGVGKKKVNYRIRDAVFGRQRYWGEPIPIYYKNGLPQALPEDRLPLLLPEIEKYLPTEDGDPPLGRAKDWHYTDTDGNSYPYELTTMPGWAGSSWYYLRYLDPRNTQRFAAQDKLDYWGNVDIYLGGAEHTTGHLIYFRFWTKFLKDLGYLSFDEPAQMLINQGMILGRSNFVYRIKDTNTFVSHGLKDQHETTALHVDVSLVNNDVLDIEKFRQWRSDFAGAEFILEDGSYVCGYENEKMSKSKYNVVSPDTLVNQYGADTLRLYIMFLGPIELTKPWNMQGIEGIVRFLKRTWNLFYREGSLLVTEDKPTPKEYKAINIAKKKLRDYLKINSFNTCVSALMICVNELTDLKCSKKEILSELVILLSPFAPHVSEELWQALGHSGSILNARFPQVQESYLADATFNYPISVNGKVRANIEMDVDLPEEEVLKTVLSNPAIAKWVGEGKPKKTIFVKGKIVNIVV
jgi:leucyl-tRNA synthetase